MAEHVYEGLFILDSNRYARDPGASAKLVPDLIEQSGGKLLASRLWEERRLAYPIKGQKKGTYWLTYFRLDGEKVSALNRQTQLTDAVIRSLVIKIDPRIADTLVTHALTGGPGSQAKPEVAVAAAPVIGNGAPDLHVDEVDKDEIDKGELEGGEEV